MRAIETITGRVSVLNRDDVDTDFDRAIWRTVGRKLLV